MQRAHTQWLSKYLDRFSSASSHPRAPEIPTPYALCLQKLHAMCQLAYAQSASHHISARTLPLPRHIHHRPPQSHAHTTTQQCNRSHAMAAKGTRIDSPQPHPIPVPPEIPTPYALCLQKLRAMWQLAYAPPASHHISARTLPLPQHIHASAPNR